MSIQRHKDRLALCHALRDALPDFSIVCGAKRYPFITIDRGEYIAGSHGFDNEAKYGYRGSVWSRTPVGSRYIEWWHEHGVDRIVVREHEAVPVHMRDKMATAERTLAVIQSPVWFGRDCWITQAVELLSGAAKEWLRPIPQADIESQLRGNERFEIRFHTLEPLDKKEKVTR